MINCNNFSEYVCAYVDNELSIEERLSFDEHVRSCRKCKRELDEMTYLVGLCTGLPQHDLPENFKAELHEKLVAVADRKEANTASVQKTGGYRFLKTIAAIAAGFFLIFLAGIWLKSGMFLPAKTQSLTNSTAMAMNAPAEAKEAGMAELYGRASDAAMAGNDANQAKLFSAPTAANAGTAEIDRSAADQRRETTAGSLASGTETASSSFSTITIIVDDPNAQIQKIKLIASENNSETVENSLTLTFSESITITGKADGIKLGSSDSGSGQSGSGQSVGSQSKLAVAKPESPAPLQLNFNIPQTQYDQFVSALSKEFGAANVQLSAVVTNDVTYELNGTITESIELDNKIQELQKVDSVKNASEIENSKKQKESVDKRIDELRLGSDFVHVTISIKGK